MHKPVYTIIPNFTSIALKNFWNILLISTGILALGLFFKLNYLTRNNIEPIEYDGIIDKRELNLCDEDRILQYYMVSTDYKGGKRAVKKELWPHIEKDRTLFGRNISNISIRFIVNCNGEIGLFRAKAINETLQKAELDKANMKYLISMVNLLEDWDVKTIKGKKYDSYYNINFKIRNGRITDIL